MAETSYDYGQMVPPPKDAVEVALERLKPELRVLDRHRRVVIGALAVMVLLGAGFVASAILSKQWAILAANAPIFALLHWPVKRLIKLHNEETPLRILLLHLPLLSDAGVRKVVEEFLRAWIKKME